MISIDHYKIGRYRMPIQSLYLVKKVTTKNIGDITKGIRIRGAFRFIVSIDQMAGSVSPDWIEYVGIVLDGMTRYMNSENEELDHKERGHKLVASGSQVLRGLCTCLNNSSR